ncbi:hypothetical protein OHT77_00410 [Streptomyces sp. NBC_00252]|uniref:hypothetical protein n=1 Tax=Streptomyces sp. NBC_00252 TaxID=2975691 RepID=UPI002E2A710D|nr:hypothetical protein [Streptomyces sp. NBC_00252]
MIERRAGLAPAFPHGKRDVFPWTTNAAPADWSYGDQLKIHYRRWKVGKASVRALLTLLWDTGHDVLAFEEAAT